MLDSNLYFYYSLLFKIFSKTLHCDKRLCNIQVITLVLQLDFLKQRPGPLPRPETRPSAYSLQNGEMGHLPIAVKMVMS